MKKAISFILAIVMVILIIPPASFAAQAADFETELRNKGFTDSYIPGLLALHNKYPKWEFEPLMVGEDFSTSVSRERTTHKQQLIQQYSGNDGKGYYCNCSSCYVNGKYVIREASNWVAASQSAVEHYLDPRNFLDEKYIFQFESTAYNSKHTQSGVEEILSGTWMHNANITYKDTKGNTVTYKNSSGNTVKYSQAIMEAAKNSKMSAYYLASKIVQEVGGKSATAGGASGTYSGYAGIYNYYNINATTGAKDGLRWAAGDYMWIHISVTYNGKAYNGYIREDLLDNKNGVWSTNSSCNLRQGPSASTTSLVTLKAGTKVTYIETVPTTDKDNYNRPWTNPYLSIYNGAKWIANNFSTQFTGYLQKFNVNPASGSSMHTHEYMANVQAAASEASIAYNAYKNASIISDSITFTIPVFNNMPNDLPSIISASASNSGIDISWYNYPGAEMYRVFYKTASTGWTKIADTTSTSYTWKDAKIGTRYTFTVRCVSADGKTYTSSFDSTGKSLTYVSAPTLLPVYADNNGTVIRWNAVSGAEKYRIFYKTASTGWTKIADTTSTSYTWADAKVGTNYTYTVRCITSDAKAYASGYDTVGQNLTSFAAPVILSVSNKTAGTEISWKAVDGAENYRVFRKTGSGGWMEIGNTVSTSFLDKTTVSGTTYAYTVRCTNAAGNVYTSGFNTAGLSTKYIATPIISSVSNTAAGIQITWNTVNGAEKYRVYYKNGTGWTRVGDSTTGSFLWTEAVSGTTYTFVVRCINSAGTVYTSDFDQTGMSISYIAAPKLTSVLQDNTGTVIKWDAVAGAENYRIFYKTGSSGWTIIDDTTSTNYTWTEAKMNTKYTFTVRCVSADGASYTSLFDSTGISLNIVAAPTLQPIYADNSGNIIKWNTVNGAEKYKVFRKTENGSWAGLANTTATSYTDTTAVKGTTYIYTVRCITSDGKVYASGYDTIGQKFTSFAAPVISSVSNEATGVKISWGTVNGAENYKVFRKTGSSGWTAIGNTTSTNFIDTTAVSGTTYTYTVRCINAASNVYTSGFDTTGKSIKYIAAPIISSLSNTATGTKIAWNTVAGAEKYRVFYKNGTGWTKIADTTSTSYTWTGAKSGTTYTFTVRCINSAGTAFTSGYDSTGKSITK